MFELKPYAMKDSDTRGRVHAEPFHKYRSVYQRDRDRIIHSTAFRRLEYKTQVFVNHEGDLYRTRLTHTIEVSQISRTIARALGLNEDLTEAIALAHDLGHTPFGHAGERVLNELLLDYGGFEHNRQGLRVVDHLEHRYSAFEGLNLSYEIREAFVKHHTPLSGLNPHVPEEFRNTGGASLEVQATVVADEIAYDNHDIDDGLYSGIIREEELRELTLWSRVIEEMGEEYYNSLDKYNKGSEGVRMLINILVSDVLENTIASIERLGIKTLEDVKAAGELVVTPSEGMILMKKELEGFLSAAFYKDFRVIRMAKKAQRFIRELFFTYIDDPSTMPQRHQKRIGAEPVERVVADYIAGMTDRFAELEYSRFFTPFTRP